MIKEFNVDTNAECDQLNLAHITRKNIKKKKLKQVNGNAHLVLNESICYRCPTMCITSPTALHC